LRTHTGLVLVATALASLAVPRSVGAQNYLLPNAPGKAVLMNTCELCHGPIMFLQHKRSPRQWNEVVGQMITQHATLNDQQRRVILAYLDKYLGQAKDYVPQPAPLRGPGPGLTLALEAAEGTEQLCENKYHQEPTVIVVDSGGNTIVLLTGDRVPLVTQADARSKAATVLRFKEPSGAVMKRMNTDPALVAETRDDPEIGMVLQGGLPITVNGELVGAIAVSGTFGPAEADEICARAGLNRIQVGLKQLASRLP
jgi:uncharacterized protein GlcG (DUF336 family)